MEDVFIVQGGVPLWGEVKLSGAKNVALKVIIASLLLEKTTTIHNIPHITDVDSLISLIAKLGAKASFDDKHTLSINPSDLKDHKIDLVDGAKTRVSFMLFAPLLYRLGKAQIPNPGGCRLGERPIDRHIDMLRAFGVKVDYDSSTGYYHAVLGQGDFTPATHTFSKKTHTGTELALMIASLAKGTSVINNSAAEPEIDDLVGFLRLAGANIEKKGDSFKVEGRKMLDSHQNTFTISCDRNEAVTMVSFALATKGDLVIRGVNPGDIDHFLAHVRRAGGGVKKGEDYFRVFYQGELKATEVTTSPHPGFMTDWQGPWAVVMTQAKGTSTIHETVFENRFGYVSELKKLGADINFFQPKVEHPDKVYQFNYDPTESDGIKQAIKIRGKTTLHNGVLAVSDLRAGATVLIGACVANGESVISGASVIERGYEGIDEKLRNVGAKIKHG